MESQKKAYIYAGFSVLLWSTVASAFKISLRYMNFIQLLFISSLTSILILFFVILIQRKVYLLKNLSKSDYLHAVFLGFLNPFLYYIVLFKAYELLPAQEAQPLNYTWPIVLSLLSIPLLKQKIKTRSIFAVFISFSGVFLISTRGRIFELEFKEPAGVLLALGSSLIWAFYWIYNMKDKKDEIIKLFLNFCFGIPFVLLALFFFSSPGIRNFKGILGGIYVGFFEMGVTFILWLKALKYSKTTAHVGILIYLSPFISLLFINLIVGEKILPSTIIGLFLIISGIIVQKYDEIKGIFKK